MVSDTPVDLDSLLIHLRTEVTPKWCQFGEAVGIPEEILKKYSNYPPEECIVEVFDYWLRSYPSTTKPTWRDVVDVLIKIELHQLADRLLQSKKNNIIIIFVIIWSTPQMMLPDCIFMHAGGPPVLTDMNTVPERMLQLSCMLLE